MNAGRWILFSLALLAARFCGAEGASNVAARLEPIPPFPALRAAAAAAAIPLEGIDPPAQTNALSAGDSVTALITLHEKGPRRTQWIVYLQVTAGSKEPSSEHPAPMVMYTCTGNKYEFSASPAALRVRTLGPFAEPNSSRKPPAAKDKSARISVNKDFLSLGLDRGAAAACRWTDLERQEKNTNSPFVFSVSGEPFSSSQISHDRKQDARLQLTPDEERALAGWIPALLSYFSTVQQTPNLSGILFKVLSMPSAWSFVRDLGMTAEFSLKHNDVAPVSLTGWDFPSRLPVYSLPLNISINHHHALTLTMIATAPRPPFLACGGIIGFLAENPADRENYLVLRIISAHCGTGF